MRSALLAWLTFAVVVAACSGSGGGGTGGSAASGGSGGATGTGNGGSSAGAGAGAGAGVAGTAGPGTAGTGGAGRGGAGGATGATGGSTATGGAGGSTGAAGTGAAGRSTGAGGTGAAGGSTATGGAGGSAGAGGSGGMVCTSTDQSCPNSVQCGNSCCRTGEWCDNTTNLPHCRCGTTGAACAAPDICGAPTAACGFVCCGSNTPCPKSRRAWKRDIETVSDAERQRLYDQLRAIKLHTYRYKNEPPSTPRRLGFIIDDTNAPQAINPDGNTVDLYGYLSMAVAAVQTQAKEIEELRAKIKSLEEGARKSRKERP